MTDGPTSLGHCPSCGRDISAAWKLIEYEQVDGDTGVFAECPNCDEAVKPQYAGATFTAVRRGILIQTPEYLSCAS
ncbi:DUF7837 family putative zinc-binding protein [Halorubrum coriense]